MWRRRIFYALALIFALLGQIFDVGYLFHYIFYLTLCLPWLGLALSLPAMLGLRASLTAGSGVVSRGGGAAWTLALENRFSLPLARVTGRVSLRNAMTGEARRFREKARGVSPGRKTVWEMSTAHCGLAECRVRRLWVCDCLGLFALPVRAPAMGRILICPLPERPAGLSLPDGLGMPVPVPRGRTSSGEDYDLRAYQPGDSPRVIHWKMSAKRDELVAREFLEDQRPLPVLTFDHLGPPDRMDRVLDSLAGHSLALLDLERPHEIRWAQPETGEVRRRAVSCEREWLDCLAAILSEPAPARGRSILERPLAVDQDTVLYPIHITGEEARHDL